MKTILPFITVIIFALASCQNEELLSTGFTPSSQIITLDAYINDDKTRSEISEDLHTLWSEEDAIGVLVKQHNNADDFRKFTLYKGAGTTIGKFRGELLEGETMSQIAFYPYQENLRINKTTLFFKLPETRSFIQPLNAPMVANFAENEGSVFFKHLCGILQFTLENVPSTAVSLKLTTSNKIAGNCFINIGKEELELQMSEDASNSVIVDLTSNIQSSACQIRIPVPEGEYSTMSITLIDATGKELIKSSTSIANVVKRATILRIPPISCEIDKPENTTHYKVTNGYVFQNINTKISKLISILPVPVSNEYQTVENLAVSDGKIFNIEGTNNYYLRSILNNAPQKGDSYTLSETFDIYLHPVRIDFEKIERIYPYDENSDVYKRFLGKRSVYVDPTNPEIMNIGNQIWSTSEDILDYARKCYEYVASHYRYLNPNTGIHPLEEILQNGGGDCGNLTSIYVSLLRYKNIPSRHIVTVLLDGTFHVWNDFYLEKYGWIPVDVTFKNGDPNGNYFGYCAGNGIIMNEDLYFPIEMEEGMTDYIEILQTFYYRYWYYDGDGPTNSWHFIQVH